MTIWMSVVIASGLSASPLTLDKNILLHHLLTAGKWRTNKKSVERLDGSHEKIYSKKSRFDAFPRNEKLSGKTAPRESDRL